MIDNVIAYLLDYRIVPCQIMGIYSVLAAAGSASNSMLTDELRPCLLLALHVLDGSAQHASDA